MSNQLSAVDREELAQRKYEQQVARDRLATLDQVRAACHGFTLDPFDDEYHQAVQRYDQAKKRLAEAQHKIVLSPTTRAFVPRLIQAIRAR